MPKFLLAKADDVAKFKVRSLQTFSGDEGLCVTTGEGAEVGIRSATSAD